LSFEAIQFGEVLGARLCISRFHPASGTSTCNTASANSRARVRSGHSRSASQRPGKQRGFAPRCTPQRPQNELFYSCACLPQLSLSLNQFSAVGRPAETPILALQPSAWSSVDLRPQTGKSRLTNSSAVSRESNRPSS
jgi:hypothetical protein